MQDIYEARTNKGQRNGSLTVYPGSPVALGNWGSGFNISYGGSGTNINLINYPSVTGTLAIQSKYGLKPSGRFDDPQYIAGERIALSISAGTYMLTAAPAQFCSGKCLSVLVSRHPTGINTQNAYVGTLTKQLLTLETGDFKGYNIDIRDASLLYASGVANDSLAWTMFTE